MSTFSANKYVVSPKINLTLCLYALLFLVILTVIESLPIVAELLLNEIDEPRAIVSNLTVALPLPVLVV